MAGDWIKMRGALTTHPRVLAIASMIGADEAAGRHLSTGFSGALNEIVTRNVTRYVTLGALLSVWAAANEHTDDGVFRNATLDHLDDISGVPGFGEAMSRVGWAEFDEEMLTVTLPNFDEYNTCGKSRASNAERQRKYRERQRVTRNVTQRVTSRNAPREEKRREDNTHTPTGADGPKWPEGWGDCAPLREAWKAWVAHHNEQFRPLTDPQQEMQIVDLRRQVDDPVEAARWVRAAVAGSWRRIGKPYDQPPSPPGNGQQRRRKASVDEMMGDA